MLFVAQFEGKPSWYTSRFVRVIPSLLEPTISSHASSARVAWGLELDKSFRGQVWSWNSANDSKQRPRRQVPQPATDTMPSEAKVARVRSVQCEQHQAAQEATTRSWVSVSDYAFLLMKLVPLSSRETKPPKLN